MCEKHAHLDRKQLRPLIKALCLKTKNKKMYLLPEKLNLEELVGQEVNMVCVGPYDAQIKFEKDITIQALFKLSGEIKGNKSVWFSGEWVDTSNLLVVPKQEVKQILRASDTELQIKLTNEVTLSVYTEESQYESINISMPNGNLEVI